MKTKVLRQSVFAVFLICAVPCSMGWAVVPPSTTGEFRKPTVSDESLRLGDVNNELKQIIVEIKSGQPNSAANRLESIRKELEEINSRLALRPKESLFASIREWLIRIQARILNLSNK
ncbi:MAG: hypothetical protein KBC91_07375 [Candidatus Omnitrophica bacterium]|nr:hypothetical protein [Candidatus Omnitrophota bacterium]